MPRSLSILVWALFGLVTLSCKPAPPELGQPTESAYQVGAYYHFWYPEAFHNGYLRKRLTPPQLPLPGEYNSWEISVAEQHIADASRHGIDFFCFDIWPGWPEFEDRIQAFLGAKNVEDMKFCIFFETRGLGYQPEVDGTRIRDEEVERFKSEMDRIGRKFLNHPQYLRIDGRPVVILYLTRTMYGNYEKAIQEARDVFKAQGHDVYFIGDEMYWGVMPASATDPNSAPRVVLDPQPERISQFDAVTAYNFYWATEKRRHRGYGAASTFLDDVNELTQRYRDATGGKIPVVPSVIPGYNDRGLRLDEDHYALPRQWKLGAPEGSFFAKMLSDYAVPHIDERAPFLLVTSWNEWNEDTGIEPLRDSPSTHTDESDKELFTEGFDYAGYGTKYLEVLRDQMVAITGRLTTADGSPAVGRRVSVWDKTDQPKATVYTDSQGYYNISRLSLPPAHYRLGPTLQAAKVFPVSLGRSTHADFEVPRSAGPDETRHRMPKLEDNIEKFIEEFPLADYEVKSVESGKIYVDRKRSDKRYYNPKIAQLLKALVSPGDVVVEVGAGTGGYTMWLSQEVGESGRIYAFEPRLELFRHLAHNLKLNAIENVQTLWFGLGSRTGKFNVEGLYSLEIRRLDSFNFEGVKLIKLAAGEHVASALFGSYHLLTKQRPWLLLKLPGVGDPKATLEVRRRIQADIHALAHVGYRSWKVYGDQLLAKAIENSSFELLHDLGDPEVRKFQKSGFSLDQAENYINYTWIGAEPAILTMTLSQPKKQKYKVGISGHAYGPIRPVRVKVLVNGHRVGEIEFDERWRGIELPVEFQYLEAGENRVSLLCSDAKSPKELGLSSDERRLGAAIDRVWLVPERVEY